MYILITKEHTKSSGVSDIQFTCTNSVLFWGRIVNILKYV